MYSKDITFGAPASPAPGRPSVDGYRAAYSPSRHTTTRSSFGGGQLAPGGQHVSTFGRPSVAYSTYSTAPMAMPGYGPPQGYARRPMHPAELEYYYYEDDAPPPSRRHGRGRDASRGGRHGRSAGRSQSRRGRVRSPSQGRGASRRNHGRSASRGGLRALSPSDGSFDEYHQRRAYEREVRRREQEAYKLAQVRPVRLCAVAPQR